MNETIISWATHTLNVVHGCSKPAAIPEAGIRIFEHFDRQLLTRYNDRWLAQDPEPVGFDLDAMLHEQYGSIRAKDLQSPELRKWLKVDTSPECQRCYAEELSNRRGQYLVSIGQEPKGWTVKPWTTENAEENVQLHVERFRQISSLKPKPIKLLPSERYRIFICSMGDIFHPLVPIEFLRELFTLMRRFPHIYMLLTKRPDRAAEVAKELGFEWPEWVWLGTTCGSPPTKWRLEYLRRSQARVRFVSMEPMTSSMTDAAANRFLGKLNLDGIDQVIVGGESGQGFRPLKQEWVREIRDLCAVTKTAFFMKQDASFRTETRPWLVEKDGRHMEYEQFPGELRPPKEIQ